MEQSDRDRLKEVELLTASNAESINKLTNLIDKLASTLAKEDEGLKERIEELTKHSIECKERHKNFMESLHNKQEILKEFKRLVANKADKDSVIKIQNALYKIVWGIFGSLGSIITALIIYYLRTR